MAKATISGVATLAQQHTADAIRVLAEIMNSPAVNAGIRALAATELINRGYGKLKGAERFILAAPEYYVYSVHEADGALVYIGKGTGERSSKSANRLGGRSRMRAIFDSERDAYVFERRLIRRFRPRHNVVHNRQSNGVQKTALASRRR